MMNQPWGKVGVNAPVAELVGIGECGAGDQSEILCLQSEFSQKSCAI
jgi:hypothetical protein